MSHVVGIVLRALTNLVSDGYVQWWTAFICRVPKSVVFCWSAHLWQVAINAILLL